MLAGLSVLGFSEQHPMEAAFKVSHLFPDKTKAGGFHLSLQATAVHGCETPCPSALRLDFMLAALENSIT